MAQITRRIGLSLGADLCWPHCFEELVRQLDLKVSDGSDILGVEVERVSIEPFDLQSAGRYDVLLDRLTHWYHTSREWVKKSILMDDLYVLNNPWSIQSMEKQTTYCAMMRLGMPVPRTWMIPPKAYDEELPDLEPTLERYAKLFDLGQIGKELGYPLFMKPYDGGAWVGVTKIDNEETLRSTYDESGKRVMHLQEGIDPFDLFVRCVGLGPQLRVVSYDPEAPLHDRYRTGTPDLPEADRQTLEDMTLTINTFFGWDFNSCEMLLREGIFHPIDFANACPDSQVTSLHYHFPWLVLAKIRWALFCAVTGRRMAPNLDWAPFFEIADSDRSPHEKLAAYGAIARQRLDSERFAEFCEEHLGDLEPLAAEYFASDDCRNTVRQKVTSLFPEHEVDSFSELFFQRIQDWRKTELLPSLGATQ